MADCTADESVCASFLNARCIEVSAPTDARPAALCLERCEFGSSGSKCHDQGTVVCEAVAGDTEASGFCRPLCTTDSECGGELRCDLKLGVCVPGGTAASLVLGAACDPTSELPDCDGVCVDYGAGRGTCSARCRFGSLDTCGNTAAGESGCELVSPGGTIGDVGYCARLCDCDDECPATTTVCAAFPDPVLTQIFGAAGSCVPATDSTGAPRLGTPCN